MTYDCVIVGASFAGLSCATALAKLGLRTLVLEKKRDVGEKLHTTGIIVKDAIDQIPLLDNLPPELVRRIEGVRMYAPNFRYVDLAAPGYYFLATNTPMYCVGWRKKRLKRELRFNTRPPFRMRSGSRADLILGRLEQRDISSEPTVQGRESLLFLGSAKANTFCKGLSMSTQIGN